MASSKEYLDLQFSSVLVRKRLQMPVLLHEQMLVDLLPYFI